MTNKLMADTVTGNLFKNIDQFLKTQNILSSGKRINKPSDDPIGMGKVLDYRKTICAIDQYDRNIAHGESWLDLTDSTLNAVGDSLIRAKELALSQANATANADTMKAVAEEVKNIYDHLLQLANTKLENSYIFAGHKTDTPPFSRDDDYIASYNGDAEVTEITCNDAADLGGKYFTLSSPSTDYYVWYYVDTDSLDPSVDDHTGIKVDIASAVTAGDVADNTAAAINKIVGLGAELSNNMVTVTNAAAGAADVAADAVPPKDTGFSIETTTQGTDGDKGEISIIAGENVEIVINVDGEELFLSEVNIFEVLRELKAGLETNDSAAISDQLGPLDDALDQIIKARANVGAKLNRLEATENHWADFKLNITQMLSDTEDADMIKIMTDLASQEAAYQASLAASARIIQPSLIDFLR
ncbi:MAG: flagellar hook-associated protein FlgL [Thermodesulfobacteriota bacterium]|nr:flagellar hook-associated protein FlgL [Thermodesulfobacteriota bacterium]